MDRNEAIELLKNMHWSITTKMNREVPSSLALLMAINALDKDTNVHSKSALDHIHNVVRDDAYHRGYEQGKADANHPEFPDSCNTETVEAIPVPWIESYALLAEADGRPFFAEGIRDMVEEWKQEQKG